jgi:uncharacterized membrane protein
MWDWLIYLLGIDVPEDTHLGSVDLASRVPFPLHYVLWGLAVVAAVTFALVFLLYSRERGRLGLFSRLVLSGLRTAVLVLIVFLLLRPALVAEFQGERSRAVALLLDSSQSMKQQDKRTAVADKLRVAIAHGLLPADTAVSADGTLADVPADTPQDPSRIDLVKTVLADGKRDLLGKLQKQAPIRPFYFGARLRAAFEDARSGDKEGGSPDRLLASYQAEEGKTALADAVSELLRRKDGDPPAAVVVVTDGQDNASKLTLEEAARECARLKVPLHVWGVGSSEGGLLQIRDVAVPETIFYDDIIAVPVRWRARGLKKGQTVQFKLTLGGKDMDFSLRGQDRDKRELTLKPGEDLRAVLEFSPRKEGVEGADLQDLVVSINLKENASFKDEAKRQVKLSDSKVRVLYVENSPRWEYKFIQAALLRDRRVEARFLLTKADPRVLKAGPPFLPEFPSREELLKYDLVILGDVAASYMGTEHLEWLREFVRDFKGGLVMIAGRRYAPASYDNTPLAEVLPVEFLPAKFAGLAEDRPPAFIPALTTAGESADMLSLAETPAESVKTWAKLPGLYWYYPVTKLRPAATALLVHPTVKMGEQPMPILANQYYGRGQVLFQGTDETWRWRYNAEDKHFARYWGQVIYQMALPHLLANSSKRMQMALERSEAVLDRPGSVFARLLDKDFRPLKDKEVAAVLTYVDAKPGQEHERKIMLQKVAGRDGEYRVLLPHDAPGRYELRVPGIDDTFQYRVEVPPRHELEEAGLAEDALREAARVSGGRFYREEDLGQLPDAVVPQKSPFTLRQEVLLWNPLVFVLFVGLISVEWVVRKFSNLS